MYVKKQNKKQCYASRCIDLSSHCSTLNRNQIVRSLEIPTPSSDNEKAIKNKGIPLSARTNPVLYHVTLPNGYLYTLSSKIGQGIIKLNC